MWDYDSLWKKAQTYVRRALDEEDRDGEVFPLWCSFVIELLCRASLAKIHPALLADAREGSDNILHACGFEVKQPKSIPMKTVVDRCLRVCPGFTDKDAKFCVVLSDRRNEDLHSGALPFANLKHTDWLPDFYRICKILLDQQAKALADLFGKEEAEAAQSSIDAIAADKRAEAQRLVKDAKAGFAALGVEGRLEAIRDSNAARAKDRAEWWKTKDIQCPACEGAARLYGKLIWESQPREEKGKLLQDSLFLPLRMSCYACKLNLSGHDLLHGIGLGGQFKRKDELDPVEHFGIEPGDYGWMDEDQVEAERRAWQSGQSYGDDDPFR